MPIRLQENAVVAQKLSIWDNNVLITPLARAVIQNFSQFASVVGVQLLGRSIVMRYLGISRTWMREQLFGNIMMLRRIAI